MKLRDALAFAAMTLMWGSSFLWIKVVVREVGPLVLVSTRLLIGALVLAVVVALRRPVFPQEPKIWLAMALLGLINNTVPFVLVSWGEKSIDSAMASILTSIGPLFTMVIAHLFLREERITPLRILGLIAGFSGVLVLVSGELTGGSLTATPAGQLASLAASLCYACGTVFARRVLARVHFLVQAFIPIAAASVYAWLGVLLFEHGPLFPHLTITWFGVGWLGFFGSGLAYVLFFHLLHSIGPTRVSTGAYVVAVVGVILGVAFLGEQLDWRLGLGGSLVVAGVVVVNRQAPVAPAAGATA